MDILIDVIGFGILAVLLAGSYFGKGNTKGICSVILLSVFVLGTIGGIVYSICK